MVQISSWTLKLPVPESVLNRSSSPVQYLVRYGWVAKYEVRYGSSLLDIYHHDDLY